MKRIVVTEKRFGYFPQVFTWRGISYKVDRIVRTWTKKTARHEYLAFQVDCSGSLFDLYQNVNSKKWGMVRP